VTRRPLGLAAAVLLLTAGCGGHGDSRAEGDADAGSSAADPQTCLADASPVGSTPDGYPNDFPMPPGTVVFHVEDRGAEGVVATGVTDTPFRDVLDALNGPAQRAGFKVSNGETEDHDAEATWTGNGYTGRWAIRESATCRGQTVIQLLSKRT
jgi:hypothetical protein